MPIPVLQPSLTAGASVSQTSAGAWRLEIPPGPGGHYRLAQLDDYAGRPRRAFAWWAPFRLRLCARASGDALPGTWGFGLWNDPFGMAVLSGAGLLRLPVLPNAAWFFFASAPNYLSLRDDLPAQGGLAATFRSPRLPAPLLLPALPALPFLFFGATRRLLRRLGSRIVRQAAVSVPPPVTEWRQYELDWRPAGVALSLDGQRLLETDVPPRGPLGLVIWIDNQFAALPPDGPPRYGTLSASEPAWLEIADLEAGPA